MIEQAKFAYSPYGKAFDKKKAIEDQGIKHVEALKPALKALKPEKELESIEVLFPKNMRTDEIKNETYEIKKMEEKLNEKTLKYEQVNINMMVFKNMK